MVLMKNRVFEMGKSYQLNEKEVQDLLLLLPRNAELYPLAEGIYRLQDRWS